MKTKSRVVKGSSHWFVGLRILYIHYPPVLWAVNKKVTTSYSVQRIARKNKRIACWLSQFDSIVLDCVGK